MKSACAEEVGKEPACVEGADMEPDQLLFSLHYLSIGLLHLLICCILLTSSADKVISKVLSLRLSSVLPSIIDKAQAAFVEGRVMSDNIFLAQELIRGYARKRISPRFRLIISFKSTALLPLVDLSSSKSFTFFDFPSSKSVVPSLLSFYILSYVFTLSDQLLFSLHYLSIGLLHLLICCILLTSSADKVISKVLSLRLSSVLPSIIDKAQAAFVEGRVMSDNIFLAQELIRGYARKRISPRCMLMFDMVALWCLVLDFAGLCLVDSLLSRFLAANISVPWFAAAS
nr:uncharacterized protein LOC109177999 [Ipomoea batatas]